MFQGKFISNPCQNYTFQCFGTNWNRLSWPNRLTKKSALKILSTYDFAVHRELEPDDFHEYFLSFLSRNSLKNNLIPVMN